MKTVAPAPGGDFHGISFSSTRSQKSEIRCQREIELDL
jgi:hypothetical protein